MNNEEVEGVLGAGYYENIKLFPLAVDVKFADIHDNLDPKRMERLDPETRTRLRKKYAKALEQLA
jgi:hypothetical protein